jgi:hypothetical protein
VSRTRTRRHLRGHDPYMDHWHRLDSLKRFVGRARADWMSQIDIDSCEFCHLCYEPVALIETKDLSALMKVGTVTAKLAGRAHLEAYLVEYELTESRTECGTCGRAEASGAEDIVRFFVTEWTGASFDRREMAPKQYAEWLWSLRTPHWESECQHGAAPRMLKWAA